MRKQFLIRIYRQSKRLVQICCLIGTINETEDNHDASLKLFEQETYALPQFPDNGRYETIRDEKTNSLIIKEDGKLICVIEERETHVLNEWALPEEKKPEPVHINEIPMGGFFEHHGKTYFKAKSHFMHAGYLCHEVGTGNASFLFPHKEPTMVTHIKQL